MSTNEYSFLYDMIGNRIKATENLTETEYLANSLNQYTNIAEDATPQAPTYDADGNMLTYNGWTFTWDGENRLITASNGSTVVQNKYDYASRRVEKDDGTAVKTFLYDGWNTFAEMTSSVTNYYVWGLDLSGSLQRAGGVGGLLMINEVGSNYYSVFDGNGNVTEYVDDIGTIVAHYEYDPYGNISASSGTKSGNFGYRFSTKYWDGETGLVMYQLRPYISKLGRFIQRDRAGEMGGANLQQVARNNLIDIYDNLGLEPRRPPGHRKEIHKYVGRAEITLRNEFQLYQYYEFYKFDEANCLCWYLEKYDAEELDYGSIIEVSGAIDMSPFQAQVQNEVSSLMNSVASYAANLAAGMIKKYGTDIIVDTAEFLADITVHFEQEKTKLERIQQGLWVLLPLKEMKYDIQHDVVIETSDYGTYYGAVPALTSAASKDICKPPTERRKAGTENSFAKVDAMIGLSEVNKRKQISLIESIERTMRPTK
jgi:RHS repeat-associated protein